MGDFLTNPTADIPATRVGHELSVREALLDIRTALAALGGGPPPVYTTGARPGILELEGLVYVLGSGSAGTITCQCLTTGSDAALSSGSWYSYGFDNP